MRLSNRLDLHVRGKPILDDDVDERAERRRHTHAVGRLDVVVGEPAAMEAQPLGMAAILWNPGGTVMSSFAGMTSDSAWSDSAVLWQKVP